MLRDECKYVCETHIILCTQDDIKSAPKIAERRTSRTRQRRRERARERTKCEEQHDKHVTTSKMIVILVPT